MGKYISSNTDIFSVFGSTAWQSENIKTFPDNFVGQSPENEYIRVAVVMSGKQASNPFVSGSGVTFIEIFTPAGVGPNRAYIIADKLDLYLAAKTFKTGSGGQTQFLSSNLSNGDNDKVNPSLYRVLYTIPFNYFGVK